jgi:HlyD family secretion protein
VGDEVSVNVDGSSRSYRGKIRSLHSEPTFTPYYALNGKDAARLSYLAEVALGADAAGLPAGLPVHASWNTAAGRTSGKP